MHRLPRPIVYPGLAVRPASQSSCPSLCPLARHLSALVLHRAYPSPTRPSAEPRAPSTWAASVQLFIVLQFHLIAAIPPLFKILPRMMLHGDIVVIIGVTQ